jgi:predicted TPR repeat methyltransferase
MAVQGDCLAGTRPQVVNADALATAKGEFLRGNAAAMAGDWATARAAYESSLVYVPDRASTLFNLGLACLQLAAPSAAIAVLTKALHQEPDRADIRLATARAHADQARQWLNQGNPADAIGAYEKATTIDPGWFDGWLELGALLKDLGHIESSQHALRQARQINPDDATAQYLLASVSSAEAAPPIAPRVYVQQLFDRYAADFSDHLAQLDYAAPTLLANLIREVLGDGDGRLAIDLGCGDGALGACLGRSGWVVDGLDLSTQMLARAAEHRVFRSLLQGDIVEVLAMQSSSYYLAAATDVFIYVGDLAPSFAAVAAALTNGGYFAFTTETRNTGTYSLNATSRYAHSDAYVERVGESCGFEIVVRRPGSLRKEQGIAVEGSYWLCRLKSQT